MSGKGVEGERAEKKNPKVFAPLKAMERAASTFLSVASDPCHPRPDVLPHRQMLYPSTGFPDGSVFIKTKTPRDSYRVIQTEPMFTHSAL